MLSVILWPEEGDFPENLHHVVYVIINKRSFESFICLYLVFFSNIILISLLYRAFKGFIRDSLEESQRVEA